VTHVRDFNKPFGLQKVWGTDWTYQIGRYFARRNLRLALNELVSLKFLITIRLNCSLFRYFYLCGATGQFEPNTCHSWCFYITHI